MNAPFRSSKSLRRDLALVWAGVVAAGLLAGIAHRAPLSGFLASGITQPLAVLSALVVLAVVVSFAARMKMDALWSGLIASSPVAFIVGLVMASVGIWNDGSGTVALAPLDAGLFIVTGGLLPAGVGPEALVRGTVLGCAVMTVMIVHRRGMPTPRAVLVGIVGWFAAAIVLLSQSGIALLASVTRRLPLEHALDASRALGVMLANSYWANFQADRFFAGIGKQSDVNAALTAAALMVALAVIASFVALVAWLHGGMRAITSLARRLVVVPLLLVLSPFIAGFAIGLRNQRYDWSLLDILSVALAVVSVLAWLAWWRFGRDLEDLASDEREHPERPLPSGLVTPDEVQTLRTGLAAVALVMSLILGWPAVAIVFALFVISWLASADAFGWATVKPLRPLLWIAWSALFVAFGGVIAMRSSILSTAVFGAICTWAVVSCLIKAASLPWVTARPFLPPLLLVGGGAFISLLMGNWVALALAALFALGTYALQKKTKFWLGYGVFLFLSYGWTVTLIQVFMPS